MIGPDLHYQYLSRNMNDPDYNPYLYRPDNPNDEQYYGVGKYYTAGQHTASGLKEYTYGVKPNNEGRLAREVIDGTYTMLPPPPPQPAGAQYNYGAILGWQPGALMQDMQKNILLAIGGFGLLIILISAFAIIYTIKN